MIGKVSPEELSELVFERLGADDPAVIQGPAYGEDTAGIDVGERTLVVNSDPISLAVDRIGTLGVHVASNDVAASGGDPRWLTAVVFLPGEDAAVLDSITAQLDEAATDLGVAIVGGHSEYAPALEQPLLSLTCLGLADRYVRTGGARPGDEILLTKGAGIEGTAILATDFRDELSDRVDDATLDAAADFFDDISVVPEAEILRQDATSMHDPTEGGVLAGLVELAVASDVSMAVDRDAVPVRPETERLCDAMGVDPLRIFGSGALLAALPPDEADEAVDALGTEGIEAAVIGRAEETAEPGVALDGETFSDPVRDDLYPLWE